MYVFDSRNCWLGIALTIDFVAQITQVTWNVETLTKFETCLSVKKLQPAVADNFAWHFYHNLI